VEHEDTQPTRLAGCCNTSYTYTSVGPTVRQASPSWVWKGEWNGTLSDRFYLEARYGDFGYYDPRIANSDEDYFFRDSTLFTVTGAHARSQTDRDRKQATGALTYFLDTTRGSHTFKTAAKSISRPSGAAAKKASAATSSTSTSTATRDR
jgi:hypothetical protein